MSSSTSQLPSPGDLLAGRFRVERALGVGGMGGVYAVLDGKTNRRVAVKVMLPHLATRAEFLDRFLREAKAASELPGDHVARVHEVGRLEDDGAPYMVMDLLEGEDLDALLRRRGPLPIEEAARHVLEASCAVAEAHARGIVHRDLKPSNLFLATGPDGRGVVKVLDFGISKLTRLEESAGSGSGPETLTATDSTLGSPHYMSPEQLKSAKRVDARADIWSLGVILNKLLTGKLAFEAETIGAYLMTIVQDPPIPLRHQLPTAPAALEEVVLRCLQRDLTRRYQNVGQLALGLAPFAAPDARPLVDRIVARVGEASRAPLPPLEAPLGAPSSRSGSAGPSSATLAATVAGTMVDAAPKSSARRSVVLVVAALAIGALAAVVGSRVLGASTATSASPGPPVASAAATGQAAAPSAAPAPTQAASAAPPAGPSATTAPSATVRPPSTPAAPRFPAAPAAPKPAPPAGPKKAAGPIEQTL